MRRWALLGAAVLLLALAAHDASATHTDAGNQGQSYRLPWTWNLHSRSGYGPNEGTHGAGAVDFDLGWYEPVKAVGEGTVNTAHPDYDSQWGLGAHVKMIHTISGQFWGRSVYAHLCGMPSYVSTYFNSGKKLAQGVKIGEAGNSGYVLDGVPSVRCDASYGTGGTHLHFDWRPNDVSTAWDGTAGPELANYVICDFGDDPGTPGGSCGWSGYTEHSNNLGVGEWGDGTQSLLFNDRFLLWGYRWMGSPARMEPGWQVCDANPSEATTRRVHYCPDKYNGSQALTVQAYRMGYGRGWPRLAQVYSAAEASDGPFFVSHQHYSVYSRYAPWGPRWSYELGAPTENRRAHPANPGWYLQFFHYGFMESNPSTCTVIVTPFAGHPSATYSGSPYCWDQGGDPYVPWGFGPEGN